MSIGTLTSVAAVRNVESPTKATTGRSAKDAGSGEQPASLSDLLGTTVPTAIVGAYTTFIAAIAGLAEAAGNDGAQRETLQTVQLIGLVVVVVAAPLLTYFEYRPKAQEVLAAATQTSQNGEVPKPKIPTAELLAVTVATLAWCLVLPQSTLQNQVDGAGAVGVTLLIALAAILFNTIVAAKMKTKRV